MKITLKGIVHEITPVTVQAKKDASGTFNIQSLIIMVPGYRDQFDEKKGEDEFWDIQLLDKPIEKFKLLDSFKKDDKVVVQCYLNSTEFKREGADKPQYFLRLSLAGIEKF